MPISDVERATAFYSELFEIEPVARTPRYVPFEVAPGILFALWSGRSENATRRTPRTSEVGLMVPGGAAAIDEIYAHWTTKRRARRSRR